MRGCLPIGPSLDWNGHSTNCSEPLVASHLPPAVEVNERTRAEYPDIRMCLPSTTRHPCSVGSCIAVTRNCPFGLNATWWCDPFHSRNSGAALAFGNHNVTPL